MIALLTTVAAGIALALALLAIVALVRAGRLSLAEAGAAAIAVRLLSGQLGTRLHLDRQPAGVRPVPGRPGGASWPRRRPVRRRPAASPLTTGVALRAVRFRVPGAGPPGRSTASICVSAPARWWRSSGENGSGKTTLAKIVAGLYEPDEGQLRWDGAALPASDVRASVSVIFQDFVQLPDVGAGQRASSATEPPTATRR